MLVTSSQLRRVGRSVPGCLGVTAAALKFWACQTGDLPLFVEKYLFCKTHLALWWSADNARNVLCWWKRWLAGESCQVSSYLVGEPPFPPPWWRENVLEEGLVFSPILTSKLNWSHISLSSCQGEFDLTQSNATYNFNCRQEGVI